MLKRNDCGSKKVRFIRSEEKYQQIREHLKDLGYL